MSRTKTITHMALLTAIALILFLVEAQIPAPVPIPGVKVGLSNIVTVYAVFALGPWQALAILTARVVLGSIFAGQMMALAYAAAGGLLSLAGMVLLRRVLTARQIWVASIIGSLLHNTGQMAVAICITGTPSLLLYYPVLLLSGLAAGLFTGLCAQALLHRLRRG